LDSITEEEINATIRIFRTKTNYCLIAHRLSTVIHADKIFVLEQGQIIEQGKHSIGRKGLYYAMWRQQVVNENKFLKCLKKFI
jgi:ATP-binding cassette subfamily B protein